MNPVNPFSQKDLAAINAGLDSLAQTRAILEKCQNCGIDVGGYADDCNHCEETLKKIKAEFFTIKPSHQ